ncbi:MAG: DUF362 domain-containing protein [Candidatus Geothermarchaeales archaeon]
MTLERFHLKIPRGGMNFVGMPMRFTRRRLIGLILGLLGVVGGTYVVSRYGGLLRYLVMPPPEAPKKELGERARNVFSRNGKSLVGVALGGGGGEDVSEMVRLSVESIGGAEKAGFKGKRVMVKPNVNSDDPHPATTNPLVVKGVVELIYGAGASEVIVGDMSNPSYPTRDSMRKTGIERAAQEAGAEVVAFDDDEWVTVEPERAKYLKSFEIPRTIYEVEKLVSVPVIKTHSIATYTMSLKNFVGVIHPRSRWKLHSSDKLEEMIAEISLAVHPNLIVLDGTKSMVSGGPFSGTVKNTNIIMASGDRVAIDSAGLSIIKSFDLWDRVSKKSVWEQRQIRRALELNLGGGPGEIEIIGRSLVGEEALKSLISTIEQNITV